MFSDLSSVDTGTSVHVHYPHVWLPAKNNYEDKPETEFSTLVKDFVSLGGLERKPLLAASFDDLPIETKFENIPVHTKTEILTAWTTDVVQVRCNAVKSLSSTTCRVSSLIFPKTNFF
jgi:hypothetical protein